MFEAGNERGELSSDPHRPPSDTGSLSPPWDRERRIIMPPPGMGIWLAALCKNGVTDLHCIYLSIFYVTT